MSTSVSSVTSHFPSAENGFTTTLASTISGGAVTVPLNSVAGYSNGEVAVFIVDPADAAKKQTFTGIIDTAGVQVTGVKWTAGTNQTHTAGATVVDYASATHISMISKGLLVEHDQDGTHGAVTASSVTATTGTFTNLTVSGSATSQGWTALGDVPDTVTANGNRNFDLVFNGVDHTSTLSPGMKLQLSRTVAAPSQCTDLEASSSQYYSKTSPAGMTFTDDFVVSAWIKLESYPGTAMSIVSRYNGTSGWDLRIDTAGQVSMYGFNAGSTNFSGVIAYAAVPLNKWVHVTAQLDMSAFTATTTTSYVMYDGVDVAASVSRGGTNPTALIQAGNLEVGGRNGGLQPFDGKLAQVAIYSAKVTQATIKASMDRTLAGTETSLISAYSFNNSINDLNANANNLTANAGAAATATDSPFANAVAAGTLEYAEINSVTFSTNTTVNVRVPDTCQIPSSGGVSAVSYSTQSNPYGLPYFSKILGRAICGSFVTQSTTYTQVPGMSVPVVIPTGAQVKVSAFARNRINNTAGNSTYFNIHEGAVGATTCIVSSIVAESSTANQPAQVQRTYTPSASSATYNLCFYGDGAASDKTLAGSLASPQSPIELVVELV